MPKSIPLIPKLPKYKTGGLSSLLDQGKKSLHQLFHPEVGAVRRTDRKKSKSMKPR